MNSFCNQKDSQLEALGESAGALLSTDYAAYGIPKELAMSLANAAQGFHDLLGAVKTASDAARQATQNKDGGRGDLLAVLSQISAAVYAPGSTVTDGQLAAIGFSPRRAPVRNQAAQRVEGLNSALSGDGTSVRLSWVRGANPKSALFQAFVSRDSGTTWEMVGATNRLSLDLPTSPGITAWYRIVATTAKTIAPPSATVAIFGPSPATEFRLKVA